MVFLCLLLLISAHQIAQQIYHLQIPVIDSYADPLLGMPVLLFAYKLERIFLWKRAQLSILEIFLVTLLVSIVSELLFPYLSTDFTSDPLDLIALAAGAIFYYYTLND